MYRLILLGKEMGTGWLAKHITEQKRKLHMILGKMEKKKFIPMIAGRYQAIPHMSLPASAVALPDLYSLKPTGWCCPFSLCHHP